MKKFMKKITFLMAAIMCFTVLNTTGAAFAQAATDTVTIYFVDGTNEQWIANDSAVIELVDNTNGHDRYIMSTQDNKVWSVEVPSTAYNITFNRYNYNRTVLWNSWSTSGRDGRLQYVAMGDSNGDWTNVVKTAFEAGDTIYLDFSEFSGWNNYNAKMYVNFTSATKNENYGQDVVISTADTSLYQPSDNLVKISNTKYAYTFTEDTAGAEVLRFWRGNDTTLWNCSVVLKVSDFNNGYNCVKVTSWNEAGYLSHVE